MAPGPRKDCIYLEFPSNFEKRSGLSSRVSLESRVTISRELLFDDSHRISEVSLLLLLLLLLQNTLHRDQIVRDVYGNEIKVSRGKGTNSSEGRARRADAGVAQRQHAHHPEPGHDVVAHDDGDAERVELGRERLWTALRSLTPYSSVYISLRENLKEKEETRGFDEIPARLCDHKRASRLFERRRRARPAARSRSRARWGSCAAA